jgi:hypothetical protein
MRRRYIPGPHVRVEGMVPGDRALGGATPGTRLPRPGDSPWIVLGAAYDTAAAPSTSLASAPTCGHAPGEPVDRPLDVVPGSPAQAAVRARDAMGGTDITEYLVAFDGYRGHFVLPARVMTEFGSVAAPGSDGATVRFTMGAAIRPDGSPIPPGVPFPSMVRIAARDSTGHVSPYVTRPLNLLGLGTGDVEVTLSMSVPTDLDLYVSDPSGSTVYYGNTTIGSGGPPRSRRQRGVLRQHGREQRARILARRTGARGHLQRPGRPLRELRARRAHRLPGHGARLRRDRRAHRALHRHGQRRLLPRAPQAIPTGVRTSCASRFLPVPGERQVSPR